MAAAALLHAPDTQDLATIPLRDLRHAIGLSGARVYMLLLAKRNRAGVSSLTNARIQLDYPFRRGSFVPLPRSCSDDPDVEFLTDRQIQYGRQRLRDFGLVSASDWDSKYCAKSQVWIWTYLRTVYGTVLRAGADGLAMIPIASVRLISKAAGLGGARRNSGGARPGAGRPRKDPADKAKRKSRARPRPSPKLAAKISGFPPFDDDAHRDLERSLRIRDDRPALTLVPMPVLSARKEPAPTMPTPKRPTKTPPILTVVPQLDASSAPDAADEIMIRPQSTTGLRSLLLVGAGLPPQPLDVPMVRIPPPPMLSAGMSEVQQLRMLARAWAGASKSRGASSKLSGVGFSFSHAPRMRGTMLKAIKALIKEQISPFVWCAWALDMLMQAGETKEIPAVWAALSDKLIHKHAGWCCESDTASARIIFPPAVIELQVLWRKCTDALRHVTSDAEAKSTIKQILPRSKYVELLELGREQATTLQQEYNLKATSGKWIW